MKKFIVLAAMLSTLALNALSATVAVTTTAELIAALSTAVPGTTVQLAPGTYACAPSTPAGVTLRGAGYGKTILDVGAADTGVTLAGDGAVVADLAVTTHGGTAILARGVKTIGLSGILSRGGAVGVCLRDVQGARIENCIVDSSFTGIALTDVTGAAIVNNTLTRCDSTAFALSKVSASAVFNNLVVHAGVAVNVSQAGAGLRVDHNLYLALYAGKIDDELARISLGPWRDVSGGLDAQSVCLPVVFRDAANGDYQPVSTLDWNPGIPTTANWGVQEFGGVKAPVRDIAGDKRPVIPGVGAREAKAGDVDEDGTFKVQESAGTKSAGVFTPDGTLVRTLFRDLPLPAGQYGFVLPSRSGQGGPIAAGKYELRIVESNLRWDYRMLTGNNGSGTREGESDKCGVGRLVFGADNTLITGCGWSEHHENLKARDLGTGKPRWVVPGSTEPVWLCRGSDGLIYVLRKDDLIRLDNQGNLQPWPAGGMKLPVAIPAANGMTELAGNLYVTSGSNEVWRVAVATGKQELAFKTTNPFHPVADRKRNLLWMICGGQGFMNGVVTAFTPDGNARYTVGASLAKPAGAGERRPYEPITHPLGVAVNGDRLAIADYDTGKVRFFDIHDPTAPVAKQTLGRGDGPYGPIVADRFRFQKGMFTPPSLVIMDLDDTGRLALLDGGSRPLVFGPDGANLYMGLAQFGNGPTWNDYPGEEDGLTHIFYDYSWTIDARKGTWVPEAYWCGGTPAFKHHGKLYGAGGGQMLDAAGKKHDAIYVSRFDNYVAKPLAVYYVASNNILRVVHDENSDGAITAADGEGAPVLDSAGKPISTGNLFPRFSVVERNGDIRGSRFWVFKGVDAKGYPLYEFPAEPLYACDTRKLASPYSFKTNGVIGRYSESVIAADGDLIAGMNCGDSPHGMGLSNSGCIDLARIRKDGSLRWYLPLNDYGPIQGVKQVSPGFILTSWGHQAEWIGLDDDGLSLGHLGFPREAHWGGYWVDHPTHYCLIRGNDERVHAVVGDYFDSGWHWLSLRNYDNYHKAAYSFSVSESRAASLAAQAPQTTFLMTRSEKPRVTVKKLAQPLAIDGDLEKWRRLGLTPQIVITPATASSNIKSAKDCSGVVRLAYEGTNLYVQVLRFDDVVVFDPAAASQNQDTVELMINGFFPNGFQFCVGEFSTDGGPIWRRRFYAPKLALKIPAEVAPRVVKVLDNAEAVPERKLVEAATGEDLSQAKVIVTEFKLPIDARTWAGSEKDLFPVESGKGFWLGFMLDDNDRLGVDMQKTEVWPASFQTFATKEDSTWVVFE